MSPLIGTRRALLTGKPQAAVILPVSLMQPSHAAYFASGAWSASLANNPAVGSTLVIIVSFNSATAEGTPAGWSNLGGITYSSSYNLQVYGKTSAGSGDKTVGFASVASTGAYVYYELQRADIPAHIAVGTFVGVASSVNTPNVSVTPTARGGMVISSYLFHRGGVTISDNPPGGVTTTNDYDNAGGSSCTTAWYHSITESYQSGGPYTSHGTESGSAALAIAGNIWIPHA